MQAFVYTLAGITGAISVVVIVAVLWAVRVTCFRGPPKHFFVAMRIREAEKVELDASDAALEDCEEGSFKRRSTVRIYHERDDHEPTIKVDGHDYHKLYDEQDEQESHLPGLHVETSPLKKRETPADQFPVQRFGHRRNSFLKVKAEQTSPPLPTPPAPTPEPPAAAPPKAKGGHGARPATRAKGQSTQRR